MKVKLSPNGEKWRCGEDDITRHSIIYELMELTRTLVAIRLENKALVERLAAIRAASPEPNHDRSGEWGDDIDDSDHSSTVLMGEWSFDPGDETDAPSARVILGGFADIDSFFLILRTSLFDASMQLMYSRVDDQVEFVGGYVPLFKGDPTRALHWIRDYGMEFLDLVEEPDSNEGERSTAEA